MEFFEPEDEYKTEKGRQRNVKTKISFITGIVIFGSILILFVQNDFIKVFGRETIIESCVYNNTYNKLDDQVEKIKKSEKALQDHLRTITELDGYLGAKVKLINDNQTVIYLYFSKNSKDKTRIPETICGNQIIVETKMIIEIFTDGGSRGNPGVAGIGAVIKTENEKREYCEFIGNNKTNNEAEYQALVFALKKVKQLVGKAKAKESEIKCFADSELMVKQLNHEYKLNNEVIQKKFIEIWNLILDFKKVSFQHIPREKNKEADALANKAMDQEFASNNSKLF